MRNVHFTEVNVREKPLQLLQFDVLEHHHQGPATQLLKKAAEVVTTAGEDEPMNREELAFTAQSYVTITFLQKNAFCINLVKPSHHTTNQYFKFL